MDPHETIVALRVVDTKTSLSRGSTGTAWNWTEGNSDCDCNRELLFGHDSGMRCRSERYRVVSVDPMPEGYALADFNKDYPEQS